MKEHWGSLWWAISEESSLGKAVGKEICQRSAGTLEICLSAGGTMARATRVHGLLPHVRCGRSGMESGSWCDILIPFSFPNEDLGAQGILLAF